MTTVIQSIESWRQLRRQPNMQTHSIGLVATMGALHAGHLSLLEKAKQENAISVLTIFVNPTQFNDPKDLSTYPRTFESDFALAEKAGVDFLLMPQVDEMYADHYRFRIEENQLSTMLCGQSRTGHFAGVLTVVMKLLQIVKANRAYFGEKDYQQYLLIKEMAEAFFLDTEIVPCPTVRTDEGLALSSRNALLNSEELRHAPLFAKILRNSSNVDQARSELATCGFDVDYVQDYKQRRFGAVRLGQVRLIDNVQI